MLRVFDRAENSALLLIPEQCAGAPRECLEALGAHTLRFGDNAA
jgi:hypothetical protein